MTEICIYKETKTTLVGDISAVSIPAAWTNHSLSGHSHRIAQLRPPLNNVSEEHAQWPFSANCFWSPLIQHTAMTHLLVIPNSSVTCVNIFTIKLFLILNMSNTLMIMSINITWNKLWHPCGLKNNICTC